MSEVSKEEQLIHALLDGELDNVRAQEVRNMLSTDRQLAKFYDGCLAQREALASLTRFKLPEDFSGRVLQAAQTSGASTMTTSADSRPQELDARRAQPIASTARSGRLKWQIAATAILSSAATLLITTFVLPYGTTGHGPLLGKVTQRNVSPAKDDVSNDPVLAEVSDSLLDDEALAASALAEPPIEQVWLLEAQDNQSGVKLAQTLAANSIQVPAELSGESDDELIDTLDQEINGILIEASAIQMKKALLELADSEEFEISAFTLPGHEAYFADIRQANTVGSDLPKETDEEEAPVVASAEQLAAKAIASAANRVESNLTQPPVTMAQQLWQRRFSKKTSASAKTGQRKKTLFADGLYSNADGPEGLGASAAPLFDIDESPAVKQNVEGHKQNVEGHKQNVEGHKQNVDALFPEKQQIGEPKGNYLLLIRSASQ